MADYPTTVSTFRTKANIPGQTFDPDKQTTVYMEDFSDLEQELVAVENTLGFDDANGYNFLEKPTTQYTTPSLALETWREPSTVKAVQVIVTLLHTAVLPGENSAMDIELRPTGGAAIVLATDRVARSTLTTGAHTQTNSVTFIVPPNFEYRITRTFGTNGSIVGIKELEM